MHLLHLSASRAPAAAQWHNHCTFGKSKSLHKGVGIKCLRSEQHDQESCKTTEIPWWEWISWHSKLTWRELKGVTKQRISNCLLGEGWKSINQELCWWILPLFRNILTASMQNHDLGKHLSSIRGLLWYQEEALLLSAGNSCLGQQLGNIHEILWASKQPENFHELVNSTLEDVGEM